MKKRKRLTLLIIGLGLSISSVDAGKNYQKPATEPIPVYKHAAYIGLGVGSMKIYDDYTHEYFETKPITILAGYEISPYLALEGRYTRSVGKVKYENGTTCSEDCSDYPTVFSNIALYGKVQYPLNSYIKAYTLLGYGTVKLTDIRGADRSEFAFQWGVGASYRVTDTIDVFADYIVPYSGKGFDGRAVSDVDISVKQFTIGVNYAF